MKNSVLRKIILAGGYRVVSRTQIVQDQSGVILLDDLIDRAREAKCCLTKLVPKIHAADIVPIVEGLKDAELRQVKLSTHGSGVEESKMVNVVAGQAKVSVGVAIVSNQGALFQGDSLDEGIDASLEEKARAIADNAMKSVNVGNRLAEIVARQPVTSADINNMVSGAEAIDVARKTLGLAAGHGRDIEFLTGTLRIGGGLQVPKNVPVEGHFLLERCVIVELSSSGRMLVQVVSEHPELIGYGLLKDGQIGVHVSRNSQDMQLLQFVRAAGAPCNLNIMISEQISKGKMQATVLEIQNRQQLLEHVLNRLTELKAEL